MKIKSLLIPFMTIVLFSCKDKKEPVENEMAQPSVADTVVAAPPLEIKTDSATIKEPENIKSEEAETKDSVVSYQFAFNKFPSKSYKFVKKAKLDFSGDEGTYNFRTRIKD